MDFEKLLHVARKNELSKKEPIKCLQTKFKPPTKQQRDKDRMLSEGVQRFLARKEEEERRRHKEDEKKREELQALRAKDPKANKRIQTMLKRTKSANKSVMEDAVDNENTADTLAGPSQPDEDDYGFVSETSSALYNKLIQKMYSTPSNDVPKFAPPKKPKSANLTNTKERVKLALIKQEEEERLPHKRKRKSKDGKLENEDVEGLDYSAPDRDLSTGPQHEKDRERDKSKPRKAMPPPVDFHELLKIAEKKQHEPVAYVAPKVKTKEPETLMTKKQKAEFEKQQEWKKQRELRLQALESDNKRPTSKQKGKPPQIPPKTPEAVTMRPKPKVSTARLQENGAKAQVTEDKKPGTPGTPGTPAAKQPRVPTGKQSKVSTHLTQEDSTKVTLKYSDADLEKRVKLKERKKEIDDYETRQLMKERDEVLRLLKEKEQLIFEREQAARKQREDSELLREREEAIKKLRETAEEVKRLREREQLVRERDEAVRKLKLLEGSKDTARPKPSSGQGPSPSRKPQGAKTDGKEGPLRNGSRPLQSPVKGGRPFPPNDLQQRRSASAGRKPPPPSAGRKRRAIESEDEYDSELDDFIDRDGEGCQEAVSKAISEIFGYDKRKYSRYDDDDGEECMESNYSQITKEEFHSTRAGILEDLQDIQKEKAMLARKKKR